MESGVVCILEDAWKLGRDDRGKIKAGGPGAAVPLKCGMMADWTEWVSEERGRG